MDIAEVENPARESTRLVNAVVFICFFVSGFCGLLYQVIWTRLAFAQFGIITPVLSLTVSTFMLGLGLGSMLGGRWITPLSRRFHLSPLYFYAAAEVVIALGAFAVPAVYGWGGRVLLHIGAASSTGFLLFSAPFIVLALLPWCIAMGATIPFMMGFIRRFETMPRESFGRLYATNVIGAAFGAAATAIALIEIFGLRGTSLCGAIGNVSIAALAAVTAYAMGPLRGATGPAPAGLPRPASLARTPLWVRLALFMTGFSSIGLEVCWARDFTLELQTSIYAFAAILATYLLATCAGSARYLRAKLAARPVAFDDVAGWLFPCALLPLLLTDPRHSFAFRLGFVLPSIVPLSALLGFFTPALLDRFGGGDARRTGQLYAINIAGGIVGPLAAGYLLLPVLGIRWSMIMLALPLAAVFILQTPLAWRRSPRRMVTMAASLVMFGVAALGCRAYDESAVYGSPDMVHRDFSGSAVAFGHGTEKMLLVNGVAITYLSPVTKVMADLPMGLHGPADSVLDICFGMGTTFRSLASWGADTTAVDLSPAVEQSFGFFHADAAAILADPRDHVIADDGRRFLLRSDKTYDVITIDPPPPVAAAGSSLLYSAQFYAVAKQRLAPGGILAQWVPGTDESIRQSIALALHVSFPYVRVFIEPAGGTHFIASMTPVPRISAQEFLNRMPAAARRDLVEWSPGETPLDAVQGILAQEVPLATVLPTPGSAVPVLSDDRPFNEYFLLRLSGLMGWL